ncbi:hypothetical protein TruAng_011591 [Truncatella angustata]|nr:hypothetical protein TruAng_011591 [Truncatella angustata]
MAGRAARLQVGSAPWIAEECSSAQKIAHDEIEEFSFSARNDFEWLNEHMAEIFSENQTNVAELFKTPGKLRGKTPRTARKLNQTGPRVPLADIFNATPKGAPNPFAMSNVERNQMSRVQIATDPILRPSPARVDKPTHNSVSMVDSGYHGSQDLMDTDDTEPLEEEPIETCSSPKAKHDHVAFEVSSPAREIQETPARRSPEPTATIDNMGDQLDTQYFAVTAGENAPPKDHLIHHESTTPAGSPIHSTLDESPLKTSPVQTSPVKAPGNVQKPNLELTTQTDVMDTGDDDATRSPSEGSSPIRPIVRKSSLNFASLPAREPMTHKSIGNRISRTSHLDQRNSYYNRHTGGKSLGNVRPEASDDDDDDDDDNDDLDAHEGDVVDIVSQVPKPQDPEQPEADIATTHSKTYTQRLQDQISKLGQSQPATARTSKSIANSALPSASAPAPVVTTIPAPRSPLKSKMLSPMTHTTPGAFPEDDDDEWIQPLGTPDNASNLFSPRPDLLKSHSADVMEGISGKETVSGAEFAVPKTRQRKSHSKSPQRPDIPERNASAKKGHHKSASVPSFPVIDQNQDDVLLLKKTISVSNPALASVAEDQVADLESPPKSPSRTLRESPLKHVKNKLSSILKTSKGLLASSAAISAEGKSSLLSPSSVRLGLHAGPSTMSLDLPFGSSSQLLYPDLSKKSFDIQSMTSTASPARTEGRRTRASIEREKVEEKRKEKEAKEAKRMAEQMSKLERAREKEREKARVFSEEQERIAAMEKHIAAKKDQDNKAATTTPAPVKPPRRSPRKAEPQVEMEQQPAADAKVGDDVDMADVPSSMPPPSVARPASAAKGREIKRPVRPMKEPLGKSKQAPTVIRVNMGSQHSQYQPSNSTLGSSLLDTLGPTGPQIQPKNKGSQASVAKPSLQNFKASQSSSSRPKALEMAARRREQEEREAQRKREMKAEMERKRTALQEEEKRQEQQRKLEAERQKEEERKQREESKKRALLEKAKQTRAPPPAARSLNGQPDYKPSSQSGNNSSRPPSRLGSVAQKSQEDFGRSVGTGLTNASKHTAKRTLQQDSKESKRMRMTDEFDDDMDMESQPSLKGAPVRPSGGFKKVTAGSMLSQGQKPPKPQETTSKNMFPPGYANAPPSATKDIFKSTLTSQHNAHMKAAHNTAQFAKGAIPFAPNPNPAGPAHKTPARPTGVAGAKSIAKSAARSSPRFQNGEQIELPEINTDDEDEYSDDEHKEMFASWTDSPALRRALMEQETMDPMRVFGAPAPLNMEEVFSKSKDRWHKFRARTSSANWSGTDRLTEDDIRKDLAARDKLRREGGWSYDMSKEML